MTDTQQAKLLINVRTAARAMETAHQAALQAVKDATSKARAARSAAIRAADDAGVPRELIADAAGLRWPMSRQRWSELRNR